MTLLRQRCLHKSASALLLACIPTVLATIQSYERAQQRLASKAWFAKYIQVGDTTIPISPASVGVFLLALVFLKYIFHTKPCYAVASHILVSDPSPTTKATMETWKKEIGSDYVAFSKYAAKYSDCPSKRNGGKLGRFSKGKMVPQFEQVCFDPATKVNTTLGPVQTTFGWHLLFIEDRKLT